MRFLKRFSGSYLIAVCLTGLMGCIQPRSDSIAPHSETSVPKVNSTNPSIATPRATTITAQNTPARSNCHLVEAGFGSAGSVNIRVEQVVSGLEVPWGLAFLPNTDLLVTERPGRVRLIRNGQLQPIPVASPDTIDQGEGGLQGIALHPDFTNNRQFYLYYTTRKNDTRVNRVERWLLAADGQQATSDRIILDDIPVAQFHNGGRIRFGPDGMLYIGTGDAREPDLAQNPRSLAGKILRVTPDGQVPPDNPFPGSPVYILGVRNVQAFDWLNPTTLWIADHGPSGELGLRGRDEISLAKAGDNLGWPKITACEQDPGLVTPQLTWRSAVPPGGAAIYTGDTIPEWRGSFLIGTLGSTHLHRVTLSPAGQLQSHEVYLQGEQLPTGYGRLREVIMGSDRELYITTSNCDGRGTCPPEKDKILRITR